MRLFCVFFLSCVVLFPVFFLVLGVGVCDCLDDEKIIRVFYYTSRNDTHLSHTETQEIEAIPHCFPSPCNAIMGLSFPCPCLCSWAQNYHPIVFVSYITGSDLTVMGLLVIPFKVTSTRLHFPQGRRLR